jgi:hypothetical protein
MGMWKSFIHEMNLPEPPDCKFEEFQQRIDQAIGALGIPAHLLKPPEKKTMTTYKYGFVNADDTEQSFETADKEEAKAYAQSYQLAVIEKKYTFDDSELVAEWDFREKPEEPEEEEETPL